MHHEAGEGLEQVRLFAFDPEVMELHLALDPGQHGRALEGADVAIAVGEVQRLLARRGDEGREGDPRAAPRRNAHPAAQADDRVEHRARGVGQRAPVR